MTVERIRQWKNPVALRALVLPHDVSTRGRTLCLRRLACVGHGWPRCCTYSTLGEIRMAAIAPVLSVVANLSRWASIPGLSASNDYSNGWNVPPCATMYHLRLRPATRHDKNTRSSDDAMWHGDGAFEIRLNKLVCDFSLKEYNKAQKMLTLKPFSPVVSLTHMRI